MQMELNELVRKYLAVAGRYGEPVELASLGLSREDIEKGFGSLDEDYHISRFLHFSREAGTSYQIGGFHQTHVSIEAAIQSIL